ncbi:MAG: flagellin N-terminal helical domain-containing protein, partial [Planctomycetota bacterium]
MIVSHNLNAMNTSLSLEKANRHTGESLARLSTGYRINSGRDAPADLVISEQLRAQTAGLERAIRNTQEASNVLGIAEGALNEVNEILKDLRSLALHAANSGITSDKQVAADQRELDRGIQTVDRIAATTKYSDQFLLNGSQALTATRQKTGPGSESDLLIDMGASHIDMVGSLDNDISVRFSSYDESGNYDASRQATRAYFELAETGSGDIDSDGFLTNDVAFSISTQQGSKRFEFSQGTHIGTISETLQTYGSSLGIESSLIFDGTRTPRATSLSAPGGDLINGLGGAAGFGENTFAANDDGSVFVNLAPIIPDGLNFYGTNYTGLWINNNGNVTFNGAQAAFTPTAITGATGNPIIAPFFADVDTRGAAGGATPGGASTGANVVYYDLDAVNNVFTVTWDDVGYFNTKVDKFNAFQLRIHDQGNGDFDVEIRYEDINWTTGDSSGGTNGLGGTVARMGWSSGNGTDFDEFEEAGIQADVLGLGGSNRYFEVRNGGLQEGEPLQDLPAVLSGPTVNEVFNNVTDGITNVTGSIVGLEAGHDTDGNGRVWLNVIDANTYELYSDQGMTEDFLVATGTFGAASSAANGSNLDGLVLTAGANVADLDGTFISMDAVVGRDYGMDYTGIMSTGFNSPTAHLSGLTLGEHTDSTGSIYVEVEMTTGTDGIVRAYSSADLDPNTLVATTDGAVSLAADTNIILDAVDGDGLALSLTTNST